MNILHIAPINMARANGLRFSVPGLTSAQNKIANINAALMNISGSESLIKEEIEKYDFNFFPDPKSLLELPSPFRNPDLVVFHGVYYKKYINFYKEMKSRDIPYIIVPRVSLTSGAQKQKYIKKKIGNLLYFKKFIKNAECIHYLTENEFKESNSFGKKSFIVGNGVNLPNIHSNSNTGKLNLTFIGRYDIKHKGLDILTEAVSSMKFDLRRYNIKINLFGSDYNNGKKYINNKIEEKKIGDILCVNNAVFNEDKISVLENTDIFLSPSRFEGHPMAVVEAMAYGIPCIITKGTNMIEILHEYNAGWTAETNAKSLAETIRIAISDKPSIERKGGNAKKLAKENYSWEALAAKTITHYNDLMYNN